MSFVKRFQTSLESLYPISENQSYVVAFSGGVDSHVLLHCCKELGLTVRAVHVHHGLQSVADNWVEHCQKVCDALAIHLDIIYVDANKKSGQSPEETARNARYEALHNNLNTDDHLLTGQHQDDQAETILLQLFRTASSAGLSAMPASRAFGNYIHLRPLLSFSRRDIEAFARQSELEWVEDPSNQDVAYDRNYLRKNILPVLVQRWPEITTQLSTVASLQSNNLQVQEDMAAIDLANVLLTQKNTEAVNVFEVMSLLSIERLQPLSSARLLNLLRYWVMVTLETQPTRKLLVEIEKSLVNSQQDANPDINFSAYTFRKFQGCLYLLKTRDVIKHQDKLEWDSSVPLILQNLNLQLSKIESSGAGLDKKLLDEKLTIGFRQGGENFHPSGRGHSQSLKKLFQEENIPPWERDVVPLVYLDNELIAVAGLWVGKQYSVCENGWNIKVEQL